jgi:hypothetical protein
MTQHNIMIRHTASNTLKALVQQYHPQYADKSYYLLTNNGDLIVCFDMNLIPAGDSNGFTPQLISGKAVLVSPVNFKQKVDKIDKDARLMRQKEVQLAAEAARQSNITEVPSIWA